MNVKIPVRQFHFDTHASWEENFKVLEAHHREETEWLIAHIEYLEKKRERTVEHLTQAWKDA